ncbi:unnamed protein product [Caenorhabditis auriculariae]|uniref:Sushi domain-containing protein n=1 Tax=Caenorhabditis auriculariae TaxID=2777116 RepID=A0A8S1H3N6_9PELO|nr:unnamed protein product [Caenorhabditis auriculariae]
MAVLDQNYPDWKEISEGLNSSGADILKILTEPSPNISEILSLLPSDKINTSALTGILETLLNGVPNDITTEGPRRFSKRPDKDDGGLPIGSPGDGSPFGGPKKDDNRTSLTTPADPIKGNETDGPRTRKTDGTPGVDIPGSILPTNTTIPEEPQKNPESTPANVGNVDSGSTPSPNTTSNSPNPTTPKSLPGIPGDVKNDDPFSPNTTLISPLPTAANPAENPGSTPADEKDGNSGSTSSPNTTSISPIPTAPNPPQNPGSTPGNDKDVDSGSNSSPNTTSISPISTAPNPPENPGSTLADDKDANFGLTSSPNTTSISPISTAPNPPENPGSTPGEKDADSGSTSSTNTTSNSPSTTPMTITTAPKGPQGNPDSTPTNDSGPTSSTNTTSSSPTVPTPNPPENVTNSGSTPSFDATSNPPSTTAPKDSDNTPANDVTTGPTPSSNTTINPPATTIPTSQGTSSEPTTTTKKSEETSEPQKNTPESTAGNGATTEPATTIPTPEAGGASGNPETTNAPVTTLQSENTTTTTTTQNHANGSTPGDSATPTTPTTATTDSDSTGTTSWPVKFDLTGTTRDMGNGLYLISESLNTTENCTTILYQLYEFRNGTRFYKQTADPHGCEKFNSTTTSTSTPSTPTTVKNNSTSTATTPTTPKPSSTGTTGWPVKFDLTGTTRDMGNGLYLIAESLNTTENCTTILYQLYEFRNGTRFYKQTDDPHGCEKRSPASFVTVSGEDKFNNNVNSNFNDDHNPEKWHSSSYTQYKNSSIEYKLDDSFDDEKLSNNEDSKQYINYHSRWNQIMSSKLEVHGKNSTITKKMNGTTTATTPSTTTSTIKNNTTTSAGLPFTWDRSQKPKDLGNGLYLISERLVRGDDCTTTLYQLLQFAGNGTEFVRMTSDPEGCNKLSSTEVYTSPMTTNQDNTCDPKSIDWSNADTSNVSSEAYQNGTTIRQNCKSGYVFDDGTPMKIYQCVDSQWIGYHGYVCGEKTCAQLELDMTNTLLPDASDEKLKGDQPAGTRIVQTCQPKFVFS